MWFSILLLALLLAGTYYMTIQGMTTAMITCILAVICMALSFGIYDYLAEAVVMKILPDYAYAIAMMVAFGIPLYVLRVLLDIWVPRAHLLPQLVDKVLAGVFGFGAAFIVTGVLAIALQMVPWGGSIIGFTRVDPEDPNAEQTGLWLSPDSGVASLAGRLSSGVFSGERPYDADHPDLATELGWIQTAPAGVKIVAPPDSVSLGGNVEWVRYVYAKETTQDGARRPIDEHQRAGNKLVRVPLKLSSEAQDKDSTHRFTLMMIRLVGDLDDEPKMYHAVALADPESPSHHVRYLVQGSTDKDIAAMTFSPAPGDLVDVVFEIPERFKPRFVAYKLGARVPLSASQIKSPVVGGDQAAPSASASNTNTPSPQPITQGGGGRVSGARVTSSRFADDLPMNLTSYQGTNDEVRDGELIQGHVVGVVASQGQPGDRQAFARLHVPDGKRLLQLDMESLRAGSVLGQALNFSVQTVENYFIEDASGRQIKPIGKYAVAEVGGEKYIEIEYLPEYAEMQGRLQPFQKIKNQHLRGDYQLVYLFLVDPGTRVSSFSTGRQKVQFTEPLVAP